MITQTQKAIEYYKLAIENAQDMLKFQVNQDEKYQAFVKKYNKQKYTTLFYPHTQSFAFYHHDETMQRFFEIIDNEIVYDKENTFDEVEDVAHELLGIVSKFYVE